MRVSIRKPRPRQQMRYSIGSISKQFTAAAVLLLQEQGKLSLDDKVAKFIPNLTRANEVTIRQLLSHTSGYQDYWPQDYVMPMMLQRPRPRRFWTCGRASLWISIPAPNGSTATRTMSSPASSWKRSPACLCCNFCRRKYSRRWE